MEDERSKKKKNKKKKNNNKNNGSQQSNPLDDAPVGGGESVSENQNIPSSEVNNVGSGGKDSDVSLSGNSSNNRGAILLESEKQQWLQREAILEEIVRRLQTEKDTHIQKVATLVDTISQLQKENDMHFQKEFTFEETIKQLLDEKNSYIQKEASLETRIGQLQSEKDTWLQKEGQFEQKLNQLVDEKNTLYLKELSLEERMKHLEEEKHSWVLKEESNLVTIANLNDDIARLEAQVVELEESRNNLLGENRQLIENISSLHLQLQEIQSSVSTQSLDELAQLASEREDLNSQLDSAVALVGRLIEENAELVEKVSELLVDLDRHGGSSGRASTTTPELATYQASQTNGDTSKLSRTADVLPIEMESNGIYNNNKSDHFAEIIPEPSRSEDTGEIVQIPLEESDGRDVELQVVEMDEEDSVPLRDAPLIGAPFRLVRFVSRYVSGADLVDKNSLQA